MVRLSKLATDKSTYIILVEFKDETGQSKAPDTMTWTLHDKDGNVINNCEDVAVAAPTAEEAIILGGDDTANAENELIPRYVTAWGTYTSDTYGAGLGWLQIFEFYIEPSKIR
jgi:hypothetical protein